MGKRLRDLKGDFRIVNSFENMGVFLPPNF